ncbi:hypothetical protein ABK040_001994 [Willaertia magna]
MKIILPNISTTDNNNNSCEKIKLPFQEPIKFVKYGQNHAIIVTYSNKIYGFGDDEYNQLGLNEEDNEEENNESEIKFIRQHNKNIELLECGNTFSIFVDNCNDIYYTGNLTDVLDSPANRFKNKFKNKFVKNNNEKIVMIRAGFDNLFFVTNLNNIYGYGGNRFYKLGIENEYEDITFLDKVKLIKSNERKVKELQCGEEHSILLDENNELYGTGSNRSGQLGNKITTSNGEEEFKNFTKLNFPFGKIKKISCGPYSTLVLNLFNELFVTGANYNGELGIGNIGSVFEFTKVKLSYNFTITQIYKSYYENNYQLFTTSNNDIYVCGSNNNNGVFTKLNNLNLEEYYIYPLLLHTEIVVLSENRVNISDENYEENKLGIHLWKLNKLTDIQFVWDDFGDCGKERKKIKLTN